MVQKDSTILLQMNGPRRYCSTIPYVGESWQALLAEFEHSLRGFSPLHIARHLRVAGEVAVLLEKYGKAFPDSDFFIEWLDNKLQRCQVDATFLVIPLLERFCTFLMSKGLSPTNPVTVWRKMQQGTRDALVRIRKGRPAHLRPPRFQSCISSFITAFIDYKKGLGHKYNAVSVLSRFDKYLKEHAVETLTAIDGKCLLDFWGTLSPCKASTRKTARGMLREFFHFLERQGNIDSSYNPAHALSRVVQFPHIPHIFTLKEIAAILEDLRLAPEHRHHMDNIALFTIVHLLYSCGLRISEALKLRVQDVNLDERTLFIHRTKFGKNRLIPCGRRAAEYLENYQRVRHERLGVPEKHAPFFVRAIGISFLRRYVESKFREACLRTGVKMASGQTPTPHHLRHSFAVHRLYKWYQDGADPRGKLVFLSLYMGHVEPEYTQHYLHLSSDLLRLAGRPVEHSFDVWIKERQVHCDDE
jgi:site-specific recombinase XerD